jgi:hypothetical protein
VGMPADCHEREHATCVRRRGDCDRTGSSAHSATVSDHDRQAAYRACNPDAAWTTTSTDHAPGT